MPLSKQTAGDRGEIIAIGYLQNEGYEIVETNFVASKWGEIDIVGRKDGLTVFFEVKYRASVSHGAAIETFTREKRRRFLFAARWYCLLHRLSEEHIRIDFIAIQKWKMSNRLTHMRNIEMG